MASLWTLESKESSWAKFLLDFDNSSCHWDDVVMAVVAFLSLWWSAKVVNGYSWPLPTTTNPADHHSYNPASTIYPLSQISAWSFSCYRYLHSQQVSVHSKSKRYMGVSVANFATVMKCLAQWEDKVYMVVLVPQTVTLILFAGKCHQVWSYLCLT